MDMGTYVVVTNAEKVKVTGAKYDRKTYFHHANGSPGSWRLVPFKDLQRVCGRVS
jgi:large subunit ribosomal protein L13